MTGHVTTLEAPVALLDSDIRLTLPARPENVAVVRHVLGALSDELALPPALAEDIRLAVSEACTNVVRHAYSDGDGTIDVTVRSEGDVLKVIVSDSGRGLEPSPETSGPGLGLPLIAAVTDSVRIERSATAGSRLMMSFRRAHGTSALEPA